MSQHPTAPIDALAAAAAAAVEPTGGGSTAISGGDEGAVGAWEFPVFVGHRRRLAPDDDLFEAGNMQREQLARQSAVAHARDERGQLSREAELAGVADVAGKYGSAFECEQCHAALPTGRLLELHVSELHDSFFAAQAARRMPVYLCLVEGCPRKFCTVEERKQHLTDHHKFPRNFHFDRIHLRRRKAQIRPLPQYRKGGHGRQAMEAEGEGEEGAEAGPSAAAAGQAGATGTASGCAEARQATMQGAEEVAGPHEEVLQGLSRLSMAAETSSVPDVIHFGRGRGRGLTGVSFGRGRGRGGHAAAAAVPPAVVDA